METQTAVTMVRLYLPAESHSARRSQMEKVLRLLVTKLISSRPSCFNTSA